MKDNLKVASLALAAALGGSGLFARPSKSTRASRPTRRPRRLRQHELGGLDTLNNLMTLWAEGFQKQYPNVRIQIEGKGSSTAPPALIAGTSQLGPMSRSMKDSEIDEFEKKYGYKPTAIRVAIDALAVYVNKDNPLEQLTLQQVDAIFSKGRACGGKAINTGARPA